MECGEVMELDHLAACFAIDSWAADTLAIVLVTDGTDCTTDVTATANAAVKVGSIHLVEAILTLGALAGFHVALAGTCASASITDGQGRNGTILVTGALVAATWIVQVQPPITGLTPVQRKRALLLTSFFNSIKTVVSYLSQILPVTRSLH